MLGLVLVVKQSASNHCKCLHSSASVALQSDRIPIISLTHTPIHVHTNSHSLWVSHVMYDVVVSHSGINEGRILQLALMHLVIKFLRIFSKSGFRMRLSGRSLEPFGDTLLIS